LANLTAGQIILVGLGGWQRGLETRPNQGCRPYTLLIKATFISS
jgi:hypothetical protein